MSSLRERLAELKACLDDGLITEAQFEAERAALLASQRAGGPAVTVDSEQLASASLLKDSTRLGGAEDVGQPPEQADLLDASTRMPDTSDLAGLSRGSGRSIRPGEKVAGRYMTIDKIG